MATRRASHEAGGGSPEIYHGSMRIVAIMAVYNEARFLAANLAHLAAEGVSAYVIDNDSTDTTAEIAHEWLGDVVVGIERFPRDDVYRWTAILQRKEQLAAELDADWFLHLDADEIRIAPPEMGTLNNAIAAVDSVGFNAVEFMEYTFVPTLQHPDHEHSDFQASMKWYYPFRPFDQHQVKAWKKQDTKVDLASSGGHRVVFPDIRLFPTPFAMKHYMYLSRTHVIEKYVRRVFDSAEVERGWHGARARISEDDIALPDENDLRMYTSDAALDASDPRKTHWLFEGV